MTKTKKTTRKGFTLIEMIISVFIFLLIMLATVGIFAAHMQAHRYGRIVQRNLENAQYALNYIAKTLRTSTIAYNSAYSIDPALQPIATDKLYVFDFSQNACFRFVFDDNEHAIYSTQASLDTNGVDPDRCGEDDLYGSANDIKLTTDAVDGGFEIVETQREDQTDNDREIRMGRVTIAASVQDKTTEEGRVWIQTSVALRDYPGEVSF